MALWPHMHTILVLLVHLGCIAMRMAEHKEKAPLLIAGLVREPHSEGTINNRVRS